MSLKIVSVIEEINDEEVNYMKEMNLSDDRLFSCRITNTSSGDDNNSVGTCDRIVFYFCRLIRDFHRL